MGLEIGLCELLLPGIQLLPTGLLHVLPDLLLRADVQQLLLRPGYASYYPGTVGYYYAPRYSYYYPAYRTYYYPGYYPYYYGY